ncbi:MAG TPA: RNA-binding cell elongation regulator Jag/EloR [Actinomycetota bacterium]|nr:RNA-binding cell elongation regulator Jag/EloR [Actinomycetota bacterium]
MEAALAELGLSEQEASIEILQEPKSGFLGINSAPAIVRVRAAGAPMVEEISPEVLEEQAEMAADFVEGLLEAMGLEADVEIVSDEHGLSVELWGGEGAESMGLLIGRHGATLDALQELVRSSVQRKTGERCRVLVDVEEYRHRRRSQVARRAQDVGRRVLKTGKAETLEPMSAFERKVVHDAVATLGGLETASEGDEPNRRVVVRRVG